MGAGRCNTLLMHISRPCSAFYSINNSTNYKNISDSNIIDAVLIFLIEVLHDDINKRSIHSDTINYCAHASY